VTTGFEIENASSGGGDFIGKDKVAVWAKAQVMCLCRILRIHGEREMSNGNKVLPVTVDMVVFTDPPQVWRAEEFIQTGIVRALRTKTDTVDGKEVVVPRERGQIVAGHFGSYTAKKSGDEAYCINPATSTELATLKRLAKAHDDLFDHYEAQALALSAATFAQAPELAEQTEALKTNGSSAPAAAGSGASDSALPF
jgi:hypothetical protein